MAVEKYNEGVSACDKPSYSHYNKGCRCDACVTLMRACWHRADTKRNKKAGVKPRIREFTDEEWLELVAKGKANLCPVCAKKYTRLPSGFCKPCEVKIRYGQFG